MNVAPVPHPRPEELAAFALGQLPPAAREQIETHIARCEACCQALRRVPDDSLLDRLRQGPLPCAPTGLDLLDPSPVPGLAAELVRHPRYRIVQELGAGGMGVVYKAEHRLLQRTVALKVINQRYLKERTAIERFRLEAQSAARLSHPNLVTVFDADAAGPIHFLV